MDKKFLKKLISIGHTLSPILRITKQELSPNVLNELNRALDDHELIKVKVSGDCLESPKEAGELLSESCDANVVQVIGRTVMLYRPHPDEPEITLP